MVSKSEPVNEIELGAFLESAGQSFSEAQKALIPGLAVPVNMMLSNAELELKVAVSSDAKGRVAIRPISSKDLTRGGIDPGMLSTLRINFVSTIGELTQTTAGAVTPKRTFNDVINEVRTKLNLDKVEKTEGEMRVKPSYVADKGRWLVTVEDSKGKVLNEMVLSDEVKVNRSAKRTR
jgi:hypothetical protein